MSMGNYGVWGVIVLNVYTPWVWGMVVWYEPTVVGMRLHGPECFCGRVTADGGILIDYDFLLGHE